MKETHDQGFDSVAEGRLAKIYGPFFVAGLIIVAALRIFFLGSDDAFSVFIFVIIITAILIAIAHRPRKM
jgi:hypothetical protein